MTANNTNMKSILTENLPNDLYNMVSSYLKKGERHYYTNRWDLIKKSHKEILLIEDRTLWSIYLRNHGCDAFIDSCAKSGSLKALKWAKYNGYPWYGVRTCSDAARGGHLELLKWARENGCPWNEETCEDAARGGHLELLKWARANGCPWSIYTCLCAHREGHLELLKWVIENGCLE